MNNFHLIYRSTINILISLNFIKLQNLNKDEEILNGFFESPFTATLLKIEFNISKLVKMLREHNVGSH